MTNSELGTRVPLLFRAPWYEQAKGVVTPALAEMVDWVSDPQAQQQPRRKHANR